MKQFEFDLLGKPQYEYLEKAKGFYTVSWVWHIDGVRYQKRMTRGRYVYQERYGVVPSNLCVTHENGVLTDDRIENLIIKTFMEHGRNHLSDHRELPHKIISGVEHRLCGKCRNFLPLLKFAKRTRNKGKGLNPWCMKCSNDNLASKEARLKYYKKYNKKRKRLILDLSDN